MRRRHVVLITATVGLHLLAIALATSTIVSRVYRRKGDEKRVATKEIQFPEIKPRRDVPVDAATPSAKSVPSKPSASLLRGLWTGEFSGRPAQISFWGNDGDRCWGYFTIRQGIDLEVSFEGRLRNQDGNLEITETEVLRPEAGHGWTLGHDKAMVNLSARTLKGSGADGVNPPYTFRFKKGGYLDPLTDVQVDEQKFKVPFGWRRTDRVERDKALAEWQEVEGSGRVIFERDAKEEPGGLAAREDEIRRDANAKYERISLQKGTTGSGVGEIWEYRDTLPGGPRRHHFVLRFARDGREIVLRYQSKESRWKINWPIFLISSSRWNPQRR